jgi:hypothetical protein
MKRTGMIAAVALGMAIGAAMSVAQAAPQAGGAEGSHGVVASDRVTFGGECGIHDSSQQRALQFTRSAGGKWVAVSAAKRPGSGDDMAARVWHQGHWMVDIHDAPGSRSPVMHTGQMCFDGQGRITLMIDRYMELAQCRCLRFTSLAFAADGKVTKREQTFVNELTGQPMDAPDVAKGFPGVWEFRKVEQLPFYSLLKK